MQHRGCFHPSSTGTASSLCTRNCFDYVPNEALHPGQIQSIPTLDAFLFCSRDLQSILRINETYKRQWKRQALPDLHLPKRWCDALGDRDVYLRIQNVICSASYSSQETFGWHPGAPSFALSPLHANTTCVGP